MVLGFEFDEKENQAMHIRLINYRRRKNEKPSHKNTCKTYL
jgi:hypothetical protein